MNKKVFCVILICISTYWIFVDNSKATIIVSGECGNVEQLVGATANPGNQQFFSNVLQGGTSVVVLDETSIYNFDDYLNTFYNSLSGVTSSLIAGAVNSSLLLGVDLFIAPLPDDAFDANEIATLSDFIFGGGTIFFLGENQFPDFTNPNANINSALTSLGSSLTIVPDVFDPGYHTATGSQIASHHFTSGVNTFAYAAPSQVSGGTSLFFGSDGQPFVTTDYEPIPEPTTMLLLGTGLVGVAGAARRRKKNHV